MASRRGAWCRREFLQSSHAQLAWQNPRVLKQTQYLWEWMVSVGPSLSSYKVRVTTHILRQPVLQPQHVLDATLESWIC